MTSGSQVSIVAGDRIHENNSVQVLMTGSGDCAGTRALHAGVNLFSVTCPQADERAYDVLQTLEARDTAHDDDVVSMQRFNLETGQWETAARAEDGTFFGVNFAIHKGEAYLVHMRR